MKRIFVALTVALLLVSSLTYITSCERPGLNFDKAVKDPAIRQSYVQEILKKYSAPPAAKKIEYVTPEILKELERMHQYQSSQDSVLMATNPLGELSLIKVGAQELPVRISIFPAAFDPSFVQNEQDFISSLLHEYDHVGHLNSLDIAGFTYAKDFLIMEGQYKGEHSLSLIQIIMELDAFRKEISRVQEKWHSSQLYTDNRYNFYVENYLNLLEYFNEGPPIDPQVKKRMILEFFSPWIARTTIASLTKDGKPQLTHPLTGKTYLLPEEVLSIKESQ